jgi:pentatricopeptide repeat protein
MMLIGVLGMNRHGIESRSLFEGIKLNRVEPNGVTTLAFLSAFSHAGLVKKGLTFFDKMVN